MSLEVDIKKKFRGFTLDVQFSSSGAPLGILGASGSGKSMTLRCIAGIETPDEGYIAVNGRVLYDSKRKVDLKPQRRKIGYLFQSYALFPNMTVEDNIACAISGTRQEKAEKIAGLVKRFALGGLEKRLPGQLSGGQQQRVALARILAYDPEVLLLDEPFSALDAYLKEKLQVETQNLLAGYPGDAVMVTHSRDEVYQMCDDLLVFDEGRVLAHGGMREMFSHPQLLEVARITGCKNFSRARAIAEDRVEALDWGVQLSVEPPIPGHMTHIGVRAHDFYPAGADDPNRFAIEVAEKVETPFEWNVLFETPGALPDNEEIWWMYAKEKAPAEMPGHLAVAPGRVLLLTECYALS